MCVCVCVTVNSYPAVISLWFYFEAGSVCQRGTLRLNMGMLSMLMDCVPWLAFCKLGVLKARTV